MKKIIIAFGCFILSVVLTYPALGATASSTDRKLKELSNRFSNLESTWGRFQIGGNFELDTTSNIGSSPQTVSPLEYNQQLRLFLNAYVDPTVEFSLNLSQAGYWGAVYPNTMLPFQVDEAFLKINCFDTLDYLGRFRFSLGPLGILSDFSNNPAEGVAIQKQFNDNYHIVAVYSRVYAEYAEDDPEEIQRTYDYLVTRVGWSNQTTAIGLNLIPKGGENERGFSIDLSTNTVDTKLAAELGFYSLDPGQSEWNPGFLVSYGKNLSKKSFLQLKAGYFGPEFLLYYSSLSRTFVGDQEWSFTENREWFVPNSQGMEVYLHHDFSKGYGLENRLIALSPVETSQPNLIYRWRSSLVKNFSPVNQLQVGIDLQSYPGQDVNQQIFANWFIQF